MDAKKTTLRGLATISFFADNLQEAKKWYTEFLGIEPYYIFSDKGNSAYIEFRIGDFEHESASSTRNTNLNWLRVKQVAPLSFGTWTTSKKHLK